MSETGIEEEVRAALDETYRPAPELLSVSIAAVRNGEPQRRPLTWVAGAVAVLLAVGTVVVFNSTRTATRPGPSNPTSAGLPQPIPQPITRTSAAAQVAWVQITTRDVFSLIGVDPNGRLVARLDRPMSSDNAGVWRSADGSTIFLAEPDQITAISALNGTAQRTFSRAPGAVVSNAFSPDGHWLSLLLLDAGLLRLQVIDLRTGASQMVPVGHDANANLPGTSCSGGTCANKVAWGMAVFAPESTRLYTLTDWGGPTRLEAFSLDGGKLSQTAALVDGQGGRKVPSCSAPAMAGRIIGSGKTLVAFCYMDGAVWFFDLDSLVSSGEIRSKQPNPFWLSPIFTPDGQLLYLHQLPGFGDTMQVVDLAHQKLLGPVPTPTKLDQSGPFAWLITNAYAGGRASTVPLSPDGLKLYTAQDHGVMVLRVPDLKPLALLAPAFSANEAWVSGDGRTIYAISSDGKHLLAMGDDGSHQKTVNFADPANGFVASEHG
jgi:WD40 repeat protein